QADAPATVTHQIWLLRCGRARSREPESGSSRGESLQFLWPLSDQIFDFLCVVAVTKQKRVFCAHNDKIVDSKSRNRCSAFFENDVVTGIQRRDGAICGVTLFILLKIIRQGSPTSDVVPIETCLDHEHMVGLFHDRVVERDSGQFCEAFAQSLVKILRRPQLRDEVCQLRGMTVEFAEHCRYRPDKHARVPTKISLSQE